MRHALKTTLSITVLLSVFLASGFLDAPVQTGKKPRSNKDLISVDKYDAEYITMALYVLWDSRNNGPTAAKWREQIMIGTRLRNSKKKEIEKACLQLFDRERVESYSKNEKGQARIYWEVNRAAQLGFEDFDKVMKNFDGLETYPSVLRQLLNHKIRKIEKQVLESFEESANDTDQYKHAAYALAAADLSTYVVKELLKVLKDKKANPGKKMDVVAIFTYRYQGMKVDSEILLDKKKQKELEVEYLRRCEEQPVKTIDYMWDIENTKASGDYRNYGANVLIPTGGSIIFGMGSTAERGKIPQIDTYEFSVNILPLEGAKFTVLADGGKKPFNPSWKKVGTNGRWSMNWSNVRADSVDTKLDEWLPVKISVKKDMFKTRLFSFNNGGSQLITQEPFSKDITAVTVVVEAGQILVGGADYVSPTLK